MLVTSSPGDAIAASTLARVETLSSIAGRQGRALGADAENRKRESKDPLAARTLVGEDAGAVSVERIIRLLDQQYARLKMRR
jgi:hypothetical protein